MAPKQAEGFTLTATAAKNIRAAMLNLQTFDVDWAGVREITGVSSNSNAARDFRNAMKSLGLFCIDANNWKFAEANDDAAAGPAGVGPGIAAAAAPRKRGRPKKDDSTPIPKRKKVTPKKEQLSDDEIKQEDGATEATKAAEIAKAAEEAMAQDGTDGEEN